MWRYLVGAAAALLLAGGGMLWWKSTAIAERAGARAALATTAGEPVAVDDPLPDPPAATEKTKEQRRFNRYDHDKDGKISRDEYLAARRKNFAKLDKNGDGVLSFDEYAVKAQDKFADADADKNGTLDAKEFATTRVVRKSKPKANCPPTREDDRKSEDEGS